jgi:Protein of unknown function (DUF3828)
MYGKGQMGPFASGDIMRKHFTVAFISIWERALARSDITIIDADPIIAQQQGVKSVHVQSVGIIAQTPNSAIVEMRLAGAFPDNSPFSGGAKLWMRREGSTWKIDDISETENETWRGYIEKSLAK